MEVTDVSGKSVTWWTSRHVTENEGFCFNKRIQEDLRPEAQRTRDIERDEIERDETLLCLCFLVFAC